jgi:predicted signal transduction protein with EAL and GGDEF domain
MAAFLLVLLILILLLLGAALWLRPAWRALLAQAQALEQGQLVEAPEVTAPGLRALSRSLNASVRRLQQVFAAQAEQVVLLQRQAQLDPVTGLPLRAHFLAQLQPRLAAAGGPGSALLLVRVLNLEALNPRLGFEATDRLLRAVADVLLTYVDRVPGTLAGRLNGSDFALALPVPGVAQETGESLLAALAAAPALRSSGAELVVGGVDGLREVGAGAALAAADTALARAEHGDAAGRGVALGLAVDLHGGAEPLGSRAWREQIASALAGGRAQLAEFELRGRDGGLLHLECPLRVQLQPGGEYQAASRWLALARRSRLMPQVDLAAVDLALQAIQADGRPRAVHASAASLASLSFVADVARRLSASPQAARLLAVECVEGLRPLDDQQALATAVNAWRPWGVRVGIEHAGASPQQLPALQASGISFVKVDARHLAGLATDPAVRGYAQSLLALIHGLGLQALAEGMADAADLRAVWEMGFDGATGPAVNGAAGQAQA